LKRQAAPECKDGDRAKRDIGNADFKLERALLPSDLRRCYCGEKHMEKTRPQAIDADGQ